MDTVWPAAVALFTWMVGVSMLGQGDMAGAVLILVGCVAACVGVVVVWEERRYNGKQWKG